MNDGAQNQGGTQDVTTDGTKEVESEKEEESADEMDENPVQNVTEQYSEVEMEFNDCECHLLYKPEITQICLTLNLL